MTKKKQWVKRFSEVDREKIVQLAKKCLRQKEGEKALYYLKNDRKISDEIIDYFNIGFAPFNIIHQLKGRIIFPIYDAYGKLSYLSTKSLVIPKGSKGHFWHEDLEKRFYLYGFSHAKKNIIERKKAILVEGEMDVAFLHSNGLNMTVGICGSSFSIFQVSLLARYCSEVYIVFDGDEAGKKATHKVMQIYENYSLGSYHIKYIPTYLPLKQDPDDYVNKYGINQFKKMLLDSKKKVW